MSRPTHLMIDGPRLSLAELIAKRRKAQLARSCKA